MNNSNFIRGDRYADMISIIPYIVGIDKDVLVPICKHGQMIMVAFVEDKFHFAGQTAVFLVVFQNDAVKIYFDLHGCFRVNAGYLSAFERTAYKFHMRGIHHLSFERIADTFLFHHMDIKWFDQQTDFLPGIETMVVLYHELIAFRRLHHHLVVNALENGGGNRPGQHGGFRRLENINVFRAEHDIYRGLFAETLRATLKRPGPYYADRISLVYGNHAAPNLIFHRRPPEKGLFNFGGAKIQLAKRIAGLRKKSEDALEDGGNFQALANEEFDAQFNALDRNNEVEFRVLFTPLAQSNYKDIFENSPYGDDFVFNKQCKINEILTDNSMDWNFDTVPSQYYDFSFEKIKEKFINFNCSYFEHMYFSFLPVLAIPVYQQMASTDYIYKKSYDFKYNDYITEMLANKMNLGLFIPPDATQRSNVKTLLKTSHYKKEADSEIIKVDAYSYRTIEHVDEVPVTAGNGRTYYVPVKWNEYVPVTKHELIEVAEVDTVDDDFKRVKELNHYQRSENNKNGSFAYGHFMVGKLYKDNQSLVDLLNTIFEQNGGK